ncbi:DUF1707 and DUF4190 domain-containing protein [Kitasatospora sp. NPDC059973]|uniref:DUF1707 and DUF4190 domain-containing protein n=1 Tax=Kitasatospora sp. NPDC059973 TaxID=3347020 RepID=UPI0036B608A3
MAVQPWGEQGPGYGGRPPQVPAKPYAQPQPQPYAQSYAQPAPMPQSAMRAAHTDRDRTVDVLKAAYAEGRLSADEYGQRFDAASAAQTYGELARLVADLPSGPMVTPMPPMTAVGQPVPQTFLLPPPPVPSRPTNSTAVASMVLGLMGLGLPAVITGHIAKAQIRERNEEGDTMATVGLVFGYLASAVYTLLMLALIA